MRSEKKRQNTEKKTKIKAIVFDIGGVLLLGDTKVRYGHQNIVVHEVLCKKFGFGLKEWLEKIEEPYEKSIIGKQKKEEFINEIAKRINSTPREVEKEFIKTHKEKYYKNKILLELVKKLKKEYILGILSDQSYFSKKALIKKRDMDFFNSLIISCDVGVRKPNLKIYRLLKKELNKIKKINYSEIVFIDNREWNLKPGKKLGMKTILFKNNKQTIKELNQILKK